LASQCLWDMECGRGGLALVLGWGGGGAKGWAERVERLTHRIDICHGFIEDHSRFGVLPKVLPEAFAVDVLVDRGQVSLFALPFQEPLHRPGPKGIIGVSVEVHHLRQKPGLHASLSF